MGDCSRNIKEDCLDCIIAKETLPTVYTNADIKLLSDALRRERAQNKQLREAVNFAESEGFQWPGGLNIE